AYVDAGGVFRVGPQSAGADPGPACYGRGGEEPTSTDAQLLLGRLRPDRGLLGGEMRLDPELARRAMDGVAAELGLTTDEAALAADAVAQLDADQVPEERRLVRRLADCRYAGQGYEVRFDVPSGEIDDAWVEELQDAFHAAHEREYGHRFDAEIEVVNIRVVGI